MIYIGIDNGSTGSIGIINGDNVSYMCTPVKYELNYQKSANKHINRIDFNGLMSILSPYSIIPSSQNPGVCKIGLERPMVDPRHFNATTSALRAFEATLIVIEQLSIGFEYIDSKGWQKMLLPAGIKGSKDLKKASLQIGSQLFPHLSEEIKKRGDADGILIAEFLRRRDGLV